MDPDPHFLAVLDLDPFWECGSGPSRAKDTIVCDFSTVLLLSSVADPGCLSRIPDPTFFHPGSRIRTVSIPDPGSSSKNLSILTPKNSKKMVSKPFFKPVKSSDLDHD
jgi:hypothetical protein